MESNYKVSVNHETVITIVVTHLFRLVQLRYSLWPQLHGRHVGIGYFTCGIVGIVVIKIAKLHRYFLRVLFGKSAILGKRIQIRLHV